MTDLEKYQKAKDKGKTKTLTRLIWTWEHEGQTLVGKVIEIKPFLEGKFDTEVNCYTIDADGVLFTTVLGSATDKQLKDVDPVGNMIYIEYRGKKQLDDGRQINNFHVEVFQNA